MSSDYLAPVDRLIYHPICQVEQLAAEHTWRKIFFTDKLRLQMLVSRQRSQMKLQGNENEIPNKQV